MELEDYIKEGLMAKEQNDFAKLSSYGKSILDKQDNYFGFYFCVSSYFTSLFEKDVNLESYIYDCNKALEMANDDLIYRETLGAINTLIYCAITDIEDVKPNMTYDYGLVKKAEFDEKAVHSHFSKGLFMRAIELKQNIKYDYKKIMTNDELACMINDLSKFGKIAIALFCETKAGKKAKEQVLKNGFDSKYLRKIKKMK